MVATPPTMPLSNIVQERGEVQNAPVLGSYDFPGALQRFFAIYLPCLNKMEFAYRAKQVFVDRIDMVDVILDPSAPLRIPG